MVDAMTDPSPRLANFNNFVTPTEFIPSLLQDYLNVRGHVWGDVRLAGGEGANRRCDCDGYRPDTLGGGIGIANSAKSKSSASALTDNGINSRMASSGLVIIGLVDTLKDVFIRARACDFLNPR